MPGTKLDGLRAFALDAPRDGCAAVDEIGEAGMKKRAQRGIPRPLRRVRGVRVSPAQTAAVREQPVARIKRNAMRFLDGKRCRGSGRDH